MPTASIKTKPEPQATTSNNTSPTLEQLRYRHPDHVANFKHWELLDAMVAGGARMTPAHKKQLLANPDGRSDEVMDERIKLAAYPNKIGPILTRFNSQLFSKPATLKGSTDKFWVDSFFPNGALLDGDDDTRASFDQLQREAMRMALATGKAIAQIETRRADGTALSLQDQRERGELDPYVILHPRSALWDWYSDKNGFRFVKLHQFRIARTTWDQPPIAEHAFTIYQRADDGKITMARYVIRKRKTEKGEKIGPLNLEALKNEEVNITVEMEPTEVFNLKGKFKFPVVTLTLPDALWMGSQLFDVQKSYYNQTASLEWALFTSGYAMPVISGVDDEEDDPGVNQKFGEGYYITLKTGQTITWTERGGSTLSTAMQYRGEVKRDIYDVLQQIAMSAADGSAIIARSGESKQEDRRPEQLLLETFGAIARDFIKQIMDVCAIAHAEDKEWEVTGLDEFLNDEGLGDDIAQMQGMQALVIPSLTFLKARAKRFIREAAKEYKLDPKEVKAAEAEIDAATKDDFLMPKPAPTPVDNTVPPAEQPDDAIPPDAGEEELPMAA